MSLLFYSTAMRLIEGSKKTRHSLNVKAIGKVIILQNDWLLKWGKRCIFPLNILGPSQVKMQYKTQMCTLWVTTFW